MTTLGVQVLIRWVRGSSDPLPPKAASESSPALAGGLLVAGYAAPRLRPRAGRKTRAPRAQPSAWRVSLLQLAILGTTTYD